jgi:NAD-dependent dihydropyrimidine dehydrogenase PreA subunit
VGGQRLLEVLTRITEGRGRPEDLDEIERISGMMKEASLCQLGQLTPGPVMAALRFFRAEYEMHVNEGFCPAGSCKSLFDYEVDPEKCKGCTLCLKVCPEYAIAGSRKEPHVIDPVKCIRCGACFDVCNLGAIAIRPRAKGAAEIVKSYN